MKKTDHSLTDLIFLSNPYPVSGSATEETCLLISKKTSLRGKKYENISTQISLPAGCAQLYYYISQITKILVFTELQSGVPSKYSGSWMDPPAEVSGRMMREYSGSRIEGLESRRSVDEFIKEQLHMDENLQQRTPKNENPETRMSRECIAPGRNSADNARFKRMTSEDIRFQLYPDESLETTTYSPHENLGSRIVTVPFSPDLNRNIELKRLTSEDIRSQLHQGESYGSRGDAEEYLRSRLGLESNPGSGPEIEDSLHQRARSKITNEYIRSQLATDEPLCLTTKCIGSAIPPRNSLGSLDTPGYIKSQLHPDAKLEPDSTIQPRYPNMMRVDIDSKIDLDPKLDIDPRIYRRVAGSRLRGPNWPFYNSRLVPPAEQGGEEAEIYNVR